MPISDTKTHTVVLSADEVKQALLNFLRSKNYLPHGDTTITFVAQDTLGSAGRGAAEISWTVPSNSA